MKSSFALVAQFYFLGALLTAYGCQQPDRPLSTWTGIERAGPNDDYEFFASAQYSKDDINQLSPVVVWKESTPSPPVELHWENDGNWTVRWYDTGRVLYHGPAVLYYSGRDRPLRVLATKESIPKLKDVSALREYVTTLLVKQVTTDMLQEQPARRSQKDL